MDNLLCPLCFVYPLPPDAEPRAFYSGHIPEVLDYALRSPPPWLWNFSSDPNYTLRLVDLLATPLDRTRANALVTLCRQQHAGALLATLIAHQLIPTSPCYPAFATTTTNTAELLDDDETLKALSAFLVRPGPWHSPWPDSVVATAITTPNLVSALITA